MSDRYTATRTALRTAGIMLLFTVLFTALMALTYSATKPAIESAVQDQKMRLVHDILPSASYDNDLLADHVELGPVPELGLTQGGQVYRARLDGQPAALVLDASAPDGYGGRIALAVAVTAEGRISGVRVTSHAETPGLGDYIDPKKDRKRDNPWIDQLAGASFERTPVERWSVERDGGDFQYRVGATISARAVLGASRRALEWANAHRDKLFEAPAGSRLPVEP